MSTVETINKAAGFIKDHKRGVIGGIIAITAAVATGVILLKRYSSGTTSGTNGFKAE